MHRPSGRRLIRKIRGGDRGMRRFLWEVSTYVLYPSRGQPMRSRARPFATSIGPVSCLAGMGTSPRPALAPHLISSHLVSRESGHLGVACPAWPIAVARRVPSRPVLSWLAWPGVSRVPRAATTPWPTRQPVPPRVAALRRASRGSLRAYDRHRGHSRGDPASSMVIPARIWKVFPPGNVRLVNHLVRIRLDRLFMHHPAYKRLFYAG